MIANIEQEYNNHLCNVWQSLSDATKGILEPLQEQEHMYDIVSQRSIQFLQSKLKSLAAEKS